MTTARDVIRKSMVVAGILTKTETPDNDEANDALNTLNGLLGMWSNDSMFAISRSWENFDLFANQGEYTMGAGQDFDTERPITVIQCHVRIDSKIDYPMEQITDEVYNNFIYQKDVQSIPQFWNYDNGFPIAKFRLWPVPVTNYKLFVLSEKALTKFPDLDSDVILPEGWEFALTYNLAVLLSGEYAQQPNPVIVEIAERSKGAIQRSILKARTMDAPPNAIQRYNILTDIR